MRKFKHFKGGIYEFLGISTHTETGEKLVVYRNETGDLFARPYNMFFEKIMSEGKLISRFTEIL